MEVGYGLKEGLCGIAVQHLLEAAEGAAGCGKQLGGIGGLIAVDILYEGIYTPCAALAVGVVGLAVFGAEHFHGLAAAIAAGLGYLFAQVLGNADDVAHQLIRALKGGGAHALKDEGLAAVICGLGVYAEGVVYMAMAKAGGAHHGIAKVKGIQYFVKKGFGSGHVISPPKDCRGIRLRRSFRRWRPQLRAYPPDR